MPLRPDKNRRPTIKITFYFLLADSILWLAYAVVVAAGWHPALPESPLLRWLIPLLALAASAGLTGFYLLAKRFGSIGYFPLLALLILISFLTITDEFGMVDLNILILHLVPLVLLIIDRSFYQYGSRRSGS